MRMSVDLDSRRANEAIAAARALGKRRAHALHLWFLGAPDRAAQTYRISLPRRVYQGSLEPMLVLQEKDVLVPTSVPLPYVQLILNRKGVDSPRVIHDRGSATNEAKG